MSSPDHADETAPAAPHRLSPGDEAPDFTLATDTGEEVSLSALRGRKVIVYFYPAAMTPGCTKQACDFTDSLDSLKASGYEVVGISPDKPAKLAKFRERDGLTITLASDEDRSVMMAYGAFGEKKLYGKVVQGVIRSTVVVDADGRVEVAQYNVKATGHVAKLRKDLGLATS
ncbi:thioredoxin-dependent thiol peroxidase [Nocardioides korecus]